MDKPFLCRQTRSVLAFRICALCSQPGTADPDTTPALTRARLGATLSPPFLLKPALTPV